MTDAMSIPWHGMLAYADTRTPLLNHLLPKVRDKLVSLILIAQSWPTQVWFLTRLELLVAASAEPVKSGSALHCARQTLNLPTTAWLLSSNSSVHRNFLRTFPHVSQHLNVDQLSACTTSTGDIEFLGVSDGRLIHSIRLRL